jgi:hypothetical protein
LLGGYARCIAGEVIVVDIVPTLAGVVLIVCGTSFVDAFDPDFVIASP